MYKYSLIVFFWALTAMGARKLQNADFATSADLTGAGGTASQLLNTSNIWDDINSQVLDTTLGAIPYLASANLWTANQYLGTQAWATRIANASSTGTTVNKLAKLTGAPSTAVLAATTDTSGIIGVVINGAGTSGNADIAILGQVSCAFDSGGNTAGHYVKISSVTAGDCADAGATYPTSGQILGRSLTTNAGAGSYAIVIHPETDGTSGGGGSSTAPTIQTFTTGSGTYTRPTSPTPLYIRVVMVGGGGGGGGSNPGGTRGNSGGNTTFGTSLLVANGGTGGLRGNDGGVGGTASLGSGPIGIATQGAPALSTQSDVSDCGGTNGASSPLGSGGGGGILADGNGVAATGFGAGGGGGGSTAGAACGAGGAAGGYVDAIITSPASTYAYAIGSGGTGTTGHSNGSNATGGEIIVYEFYQ